ncbi:MAG TPA: tRNA pseudouridine(38-40) synthase TruA, partial [Flavobacteriales bacterium]|nr:tRNA pseudouridine(38-40) synthase TruA [Flavobacteriales bacterium]
MPRYFLELIYDGTPFKGWQRQAAASSVQEEVERALQLRLRQPKVNAVGCGRTDTGVHASSYFLHFDTMEPIPDALRFARGLDAVLPPSI